MSNDNENPEEKENEVWECLIMDSLDFDENEATKLISEESEDSYGEEDSMNKEKEIDVNHCPVCGSNNIDCFDESCEDSMIIEHCSCCDCSSTWDIFYTANCIDNIKKGNDND